MVVLKGGGKLDAYLDDIANRLGQGGVLKVGFLEGATYADGTSVPMVAAVQNFGAPAMGIPPRPFFSNMIAEKAEGWGGSLARILKLQHYDVPKSLALMGEGIKGQLQTSITETNAPPLAPATIARKGFAKPLIDDAIMFNAVDYEVSE